ncbi:MAG: biotin--[acetyl-CoA-carboxylase] ligase [Planctomycetaceae bacterium]|nr:biotin--[acetyl-CoA-carboxylase] ligase [Planctomycetaceae bacterium]
MLIEYHDLLPSTNDRVKELLKQEEPPKMPILVVAKRQTAGRGRTGKTWWSPDGALLMSAGFDIGAFNLKRDDLSAAALTAGEIICGVLREHFAFGNRVQIRLPNDVYIDGKKVAGVLIESPLPRYAVIGIGMNVNNRTADIPPEQQAVLEQRQITSLIDILGSTAKIPVLTADIFFRLKQHLQKNPVS